MMKIYFPVSEPSERTINPFVISLGEALKDCGCTIVYGLDRLWTDEVLNCDIVHFQWPEFIFKQTGPAVSVEQVERLKQRLTLLKERGIKIFCTCHNLKPHTNGDANVARLYDLLYSNADGIHHMGEYSCRLLQSQYPQAYHFVAPHHIYDNIIHFQASQQEARQRLHIPSNKSVVLCFGKFRNEKERNFVLFLQKKLKDCLFLTPGFYRETLHTPNPKKLLVRACNTLRYRLKGIRFSNDVIPSNMMQHYFCAADVVLIQRLDILNSGNLPMAFAAGKVVVGPDMGNVGPLLSTTGNYLFDPQNVASAAETIMKALNDKEKGDANRTYAEKYWASGVIAAQMKQCYEQTKK